MLGPTSSCCLGGRVLSNFPGCRMGKVGLRFLVRSGALTRARRSCGSFVHSYPSADLAGRLQETCSGLLPFRTKGGVQRDNLVVTSDLRLIGKDSQGCVLLFLSAERRNLPTPDLRGTLSFGGHLRSRKLTSVIRLRLCSGFRSGGTGQMGPFGTVSSLRVRRLEHGRLNAIAVLVHRSKAVLRQRFAG